MVIKVLGPGCARCNVLEQKVRELVNTHQIPGEVQKISDIAEMFAYGIVRTPGLVINEKLKCSGIIPRDEQILQWLMETQ